MAAAASQAKPLLACPECGHGLDPATWNQAGFQPCPICQALLSVQAFPALLTTPGPVQAVAALPGDSTCYFHGNKQAAAACDQCGRFLCALCEIEVGAEHWCAPCLSTRQQTSQTGRLRTRHRHDDYIALSVAGWPLLFWPLTVLTAPLVLYLAARYWRRNRSLTPRWPWRWVLAVLLAGAQLIGWILLFAALLRPLTQAR